MTVRVRFAPSPTGDLHIGGVRTALYNFLFARHEKGTFVLRIEDTDQKRNREDSLATIKDGLAWCGLSWDEGPHYQSLRLERYRECAAKLEKDDRAYWQEDPEKGKALRYRIDRGPCAWEDLVHGPSKMDTSADPDLVIIKSDGFPTYNFAVVIDDHDMEISHVLRGDEHYSNTPKQISLYRAFGWTPPKFGHMPLIFAPDGTKISKRETEKYNAMGLPVTVGDCRRLGYLPEATINFLALLGWSPGNDLELMTLDVMVEKFTIDRIGNTPAKFLVDKLLFMNAHYIKKTPIDKLVELCRPYLGKAYDLSRVPAEKLRSAVAQQQERLKRLDEIVPLTKFFFAPVAYDPAAVEKFLKNGGFDVVRTLKAELAAAPDFGKERVESLLKGVAEKRGLKMGGVAQPLRVAVTGTAQSPPIHDVLDLLGRETVLERIDRALALSEKTMNPVLVVGSVALDTVETPGASRDSVLGGSATFFALSARRFAPVRLVGVVGQDFPAEHRDLLASGGIDLEGLQVAPRPTFRWHGRYDAALAGRETVSVDLEILELFKPELPESYRDSKFVLLGNTSPKVQAIVLSQLREPRFTLLDSMNVWIQTEREGLMALLPKVSALCLDATEARMLANTSSVAAAVRTLLGSGLRCLIVKRGEHGSSIHTRTFSFAAPAFPTDRVVDPTGAGDAFAGGLLGYLAKTGFDDERLKKALLHGAVMGSLAVESFGPDRLVSATDAEISQRYLELAKMISL